MKNFTHIKTLLVALLVNVVSGSMAQTGIRPYERWNEIAFVSLSGHQPANYVRKDNAEKSLLKHVAFYIEGGLMN